jgi:hypothetical protein
MMSPLTDQSMLLESLHLRFETRRQQMSKIGAIETWLDSEKNFGEEEQSD